MERKTGVLEIVKKLKGKGACILKKRNLWRSHLAHLNATQGAKEEAHSQQTPSIIGERMLTPNEKNISGVVGRAERDEMGHLKSAIDSREMSRGGKITRGGHGAQGACGSLNA